MNWLKSRSHGQLALLGLVFAAITLVAVNMISQIALGTWRADLTESKLYTISEPTRQVLASLDEPVKITLYYSRALGDQAPQYAAHAERVRGLLQVYSDLAGGNLKFDVIDPEPFSDAEDRAVAAGLSAVPIDNAGRTVYLGVVGTNSTDDQETIPFLTTDREDFVEYDLTKLILRLGDPARKTVGLITSLGVAGGMDPQRGQVPAWLVHQQLSEFYNVEPINPAAGPIPGNIDVLMLVAPPVLDDNAAFAIDQFALSGKPVVAFLDPFAETSPQKLPMLGKDDKIHALMKSWGADIEPGKVVGDIDQARQVQFEVNGSPQVASYVVWLNLDKPALDQGSALVSSIGHIVMASAGAISPVKDAGTTFRPVILSSPRAMLIEANEMRIPDPLRLLNAYEPGDRSLVLAARLRGQANSAFPDGAPVGKDAPKGQSENAAETEKSAEPLKKGEINIVVISDADMLFDTFWAQTQNVLGQRLVIPRANNVDFLMNTLENVTGGAVLASLRGRGVAERPFTMVRDIQREAEAKFRQREQALNTKLEETQKKLSEIQTRSQGGKVILSDEDKQAILGFRKELVVIRKDLREVQRALNADIEALGFWVKTLNIAGVPALIGLAAGGIALSRRRRKRRK